MEVKFVTPHEVSNQIPEFTLEDGLVDGFVESGLRRETPLEIVDRFEIILSQFAFKKEVGG